MGIFANKRYSIPKGSIPWNKGLKNHLSLDTLAKMRKPHLKPAWNKGIPHSQETKQKLRDAKLGKIGVLCNAYKNGSSRNKHYLSNPKYKKWRDEVFKRDDFTCQNCGERGIYLEAHHIKSWAKYIELRFEVTNGVTYCRDCHIELDSFRARFKK